MLTLRKASDMFEMIADIREEIVKYCLNVSVETRTERQQFRLARWRVRKNIMTRSLQLLVEMVSSIRPTESRFRCLFVTAQSLRLAGMIRAGPGKKYKNWPGKFK